MNEQVKPGYKLTEVGVIPEDWEVKTFAELFTFSGGYTASRDQLSDTGYYYLHYGDIHTSPKSYINIYYGRITIQKLDITLGQISKKSLLVHGDVVFVDASEDDEGTSRHHVIINPGMVPFISGLHTIVAKPKNGDLTTDFKRHCFQTQAVKNQFRFFSVGTKVSGISKSNIAKVLLAFPTAVDEQEAIANALSDADGLIESLEHLVAKKRQIKQGAMQELLTGQKRLPGFTGEWEVKRLGELGSFLKGSGVTKSQAQSGDLPCIRYGEIYTRHNDYIRSFHSWISTDVAETATRLRRGDILFAGSGETKEDIGKCVSFIDDIEAYAGGDIVILRTERVDPLFLGFYLNTAPIARQKASKGQGDAVVHISGTALAKIQGQFPQPAEQSAIAAILTDMDAEIAGLESKLTKARRVKQGMMQELLTGRIRLV